MLNGWASHVSRLDQLDLSAVCGGPLPQSSCFRAAVHAYTRRSSVVRRDSHHNLHPQASAGGEHPWVAGCVHSLARSNMPLTEDPAARVNKHNVSASALALGLSRFVASTVRAVIQTGVTPDKASTLSWLVVAGLGLVQRTLC